MWEVTMAEWDALSLTRHPLELDGQIEFQLACAGVLQASCKAQHAQDVVVLGQLQFFGDRIVREEIERIFREAAEEWRQELSAEGFMC